MTVESSAQPVLGGRKGSPGSLSRRPRTTLSVCCIANSPGPFLKAALSPLREIADEVLIAAGGPVSEFDLRHYAEVADQLFSIEFDFTERHLGWLHAQCRGDWILRLDGDEVPSPDMLSEVQRARDERRLGSVLFARRHPFPSVESYIVQEPWYPDFQVRMVRNNGSLRFSGLMHSAAERILPARMVEAPLYHLPFILGSLEQRRMRAERYEARRPGLLGPSKLPANTALLPETLPGLVTAPIPSEHRREIDIALAACGPAQTSSAPRAVSLEETDRFWSQRAVPESAYRASILLVGTPVPLCPAERRALYFRVRNEGSELWGWDASIGPYFHVVHRLVDSGGAPVDDWQPSFFTEWVQPGATTIVPGHIDAPAESGRYLLEVKVRRAPERLFGDFQCLQLVVRPEGAWKA